jgi:uncharacterized protein
MKYRTLIILMTATVAMASAQEKPIKVVFDITSKDTATHSAVVRHVTMMSKSYPQSTFEVVIYGGALPMVLSEKSTVQKKLSQLVTSKNVSFKVCAVTMSRWGATQANLIPGVAVVPDGILEIVTLQRAGYGYIKEAHN